MQGSSAAVDPSPVLAMNLSSISCTDHATPETPSPLLPTAPTTPDVTVPWPTSSAGGPVLATALRPLRLSVSEVEANDAVVYRSEEHTSELQSPCNLVCRLLLEKKKNI